MVNSDLINTNKELSIMFKSAIENTIQIFKNSIVQEMYSDELYDQLKQLTDADVFSSDELTILSQVFTGVVGEAQQPKSCFKIIPNKDKTEFMVFLPQICSNGKKAVLIWGDQQISIEAEKIEEPFDIGAYGASLGLMYNYAESESGDVSYDFAIEMSLKFDVKEDNARDYAASTVAVTRSKNKWGVIQKFLIVRAEIAKLKHLTEFGGGSFIILTIEKKESADKLDEHGNKKTYWSTIIETAAGEAFLAFLPTDKTFDKGDRFTIAKDGKITCDRLDCEVSIGAGSFVKLSELPLGEYTVIKITEAKGDYPGFNLHLLTGEIVSGNAKIKDWVKLQPGCGGLVTADNPAILTISDHRTLKNKKTQAVCFIRMKQASFMDKLLKRSPVATSVAATPTHEEVAAYTVVATAAPAEEDTSWIPR